MRRFGLRLLWTKTVSILAITSICFSVCHCNDSGENSVDLPSGDLDQYVSDITVTIHPSIGSLVVVSWQQLEAQTGWVEYSFDDGVWLQSPDGDFAVGAHEELLLGIPYGVPVSVRLINELDEVPVSSEEVSITTDSLSSSVPAATVLTALPDEWDSSRPYLLASIEDWTIILDREGRVVWMIRTPIARVTMHTQISNDGDDILVDHNSFWSYFDNGQSSTVNRIKIDGTVVETYETPGMHHPFMEMGDESIVWSAMDDSDEIIQRLLPDGTIESIATCTELLGGLGGSSYCGSNTIRWHEPSNSLLYSLYSHDTIVEVDIGTGLALRIFGQHEDTYSFDPEDSTFWWQHGGHYTAEGTLLTSSHRAEGNEELVVREYEIDDEQQTLTEIWSFGVGEGVEGEYMGEAHRLPNGNTLHNYGSNPRVREVSPDGTVVWDVEWGGQGDRELGRTTPIADLYAFAP